MKACIKSLPVLFLFLVSCNRISLVDSCVCDELQDYCCLVDVIITEDKIEFNNKRVDSLSQIDDLISEFINLPRETDKSNIAGKLFIDKDCNFSTINSIFNEFRRSNLLKMYLKVNSIKDSCWLSFVLPLDYDFTDSIYHRIMTISNTERDSLGFLFIKYYSEDKVFVNEDLITREELATQLDTIIESEKRYHYLIFPDMNNTFGEVFSLVNLYLSELEKMKKRYIPSGKTPLHEYNDEKQLYYFKEKYHRKYSIMYSRNQE